MNQKPYNGKVWKRMPDADEFEPFTAVYSPDFATLKEAKRWVEFESKNAEYATGSGEVEYDPQLPNPAERTWIYDGKWSEVKYD